MGLGLGLVAQHLSLARVGDERSVHEARGGARCTVAPLRIERVRVPTQAVLTRVEGVLVRVQARARVTLTL